MGRRLTTLEFIERARNVHSNKYDYSKVEYIDSKAKVCIICPTHGEFWQKPNDHLNGKGCKICGRENTSIKATLTTKMFEERANKVHNYFYDYSKVSYVNGETIVKIICPKHGEFLQKPHVHLKGYGCPKCGYEKVSRSLTSNTEKFIQEAKKIHGDKYDYSKVEYNGNKKKVCIICPKHGEFWQKPNSHLNGQGCYKCGIEKSHAQISNEEFIGKARAIHGDKYNYSKVEYTDSKTKVCIVCPKHGEFWQTPAKHLQNQGCPFCNESHLEKEVVKLLENKHIKFSREKRFEWLGLLRLDFYLPKYNIVIECQGEQHFKPFSFWNEKSNKTRCDNLIIVKNRDKKKRELCEQHGIKIFYYSNLGIDYPYKVYEDFDEMLKAIKDYAYFKTMKEVLCEAK